MQQLDIIRSRRKGEVLVAFANEVFEAVQLVFHANTLKPIANTLHFGLKPGHLMVYVKRRAEDRGRWLLKDAGYLNYFRADMTRIKQTAYNTLDKQKLFSRGRIRVKTDEDAVTLTMWSILPIHRRRVVFRFSDTAASLEVDDRYLGNRKVYWNFAEHFESRRAWHHQHRRLDL